MRTPGWGGRRSTPSFSRRSEGVWFTNFDPAKHVTAEAEYHPGYPVRCAIDAGTSRHTAAVFYQVRSSSMDDRPRVTVFGEYHKADVVSYNNARAIKAHGRRPTVSWADRSRQAGSGGDGAVVAGSGGLWRIRASFRPADHVAMAAASRPGRAGYNRAAAGCRLPDDSPEVREAQGGIRKLLPPAKRSQSGSTFRRMGIRKKT